MGRDIAEIVGDRLEPSVGERRAARVETTEPHPGRTQRHGGGVADARGSYVEVGQPRPAFARAKARREFDERVGREQLAPVTRGRRVKRGRRVTRGRLGDTWTVGAGLRAQVEK